MRDDQKNKQSVRKLLQDARQEMYVIRTEISTDDGREINVCVCVCMCIRAMKTEPMRFDIHSM